MKRKEKNRIVRAAVQVIFFFSAPGLFSAAFSGARYIAGQMGAGELVELSVFVKLMLVLLAYTIVFGRFFCGYVCAFGSVGDALYEAVSFLRRTVKRKAASRDSGNSRGSGNAFKLSESTKSIINKLSCIKFIFLAAILGMCFFGYYSRVSAADPWELFAAFTAGSFSLKGAAWSVAILGGILIGMCCVPRFFCRFLCPMGAIFALMPVIPAFVPVKDKENCIKGCSLCQKNCPAALTLEEGSGECFQCGACIDVCPKENVKIGLKKLRGTEIPVVLLKAVLLFAVCWPWI